MTLVKVLGQRYLWVDAVCINQNDNTQKLQQIKSMSDIYEGAYATVVALSSDSAEASLPRVRQNATPYPQSKCLINGIRLMGLGPSLAQLIMHLPWGKRSWTCQEEILITRCIYISEYPTHFECNAMKCCETLHNTSSVMQQEPFVEASSQIENSHLLLKSGAPRDHRAKHAFGLYANHVLEYTHRFMTNQSDTLYASSGILQRLEMTCYKKGMFWALACEDMNWALLWTSVGEPKNEAFPKRSWLSWQGVNRGGIPASLSFRHCRVERFRAWISYRLQ